MLSPMFGEFMGTMVLLGNGVIADVALARSKAEGGGWIVISAGWGFPAKAGIFTAIARGSKDAYGEIIPPNRLVFVAGCLLSRPNLPAGLRPFLVGALVWGLLLALAGTTGSSMNPAPDHSSRIAHTILPIPRKGSSDWGYAPISVLGTLAGRLLGGWAFRLLRV